MCNSFAQNNPIKTGNTDLEYADEIKYLDKIPNKDGDPMLDITDNKTTTE